MKGQEYGPKLNSVWSCKVKAKLLCIKFINHQGEKKKGKSSSLNSCCFAKKIEVSGFGDFFNYYFIFNSVIKVC